MSRPTLTPEAWAAMSPDLQRLNPHLAPGVPTKGAKAAPPVGKASAAVTGWLLTVPLRTGRGKNDRHAHWSGQAKQTKAERAAVRAVLPPRGVAGQSFVPRLPVVVTMTRVAPSDGLDEHDNLSSSLKAVADEITDWLGLESDRDERVAFRYDQRRGLWSVEIRIEGAV